jgi:hypothetical protein
MRPSKTDWLQEKQLATLLRVCQDWTQVALCTPLLWTHLELQVSDSVDKRPLGNGFVGDLQRWFGRTQHAPLSLTLLFAKERPADDGRVPGRYHGFLRENRERWRELVLSTPILGGVIDLFERGQGPVKEEEQADAVAESQGEGQGSDVWSNLEVLSLSGWLSTNAVGEIFALEDRKLSTDTSPLRWYTHA